MSPPAFQAREALFQDLVARRVTGEALYARVAALARMTGGSAASILLDLRAEAFGLGPAEPRIGSPVAGGGDPAA